MATLTELFTSIANAIRGKTGKGASIKALDFPTEISSISVGITPTGTKPITQNGNYDVTEFASASVAVPASGITPTGTKDITTNGTHDVTNFASAKVSVPSKVEVIKFTLASDLTQGTHTLVTGNAFIKANRSDPRLVCMLTADAPVTSGNNVSMITVTNRALAGVGTTNTGFAFACINNSSTGNYVLVNKFTSSGYNQALYSDANGNLVVTLGSSRVLKAGSYTVVVIIE